MIKIETLEIIDVLPSVIFKAMTQNQICVMIARGDLAVEVGYERLSELQEEIQWICEAAHIPVIWATQVLENLVKTGIPTRAEMSDITLGSKSECIMLNKGDYLNDAVILLNDVLCRFAKHQYKKRSEIACLGHCRKYVESIKEKETFSFIMETLLLSIITVETLQVAYLSL